MTDLTDFCLARITDDEAWARERQHEAIRKHKVSAHRPHLAPDDYERVLRQCAALRAVVELHKADGIYGEECVVCFSGDHDRLDEPTHEPYPCPTLRAVASIWAEHDAYDPAWRLG